jgi:hypothetical protein
MSKQVVKIARSSERLRSDADVRIGMIDPHVGGKIWRTQF